MVLKEDTQISLNQAEQVIETCLSAGKILMEHWPGGSVRRPIEVKTKSDGSIVTSADYASNGIIVSKLKELFPKDAILSEEGPDPYVPGSARRVWILDPLDGTKHFSEGRNTFSILLAQTFCGSGCFGLMHFPAQNKTAYGIKGQGAWDWPKRELLRIAPSSELKVGSIYASGGLRSKNEFFSQPVLDAGSAFFRVCTGEMQGVVLEFSRIGGDWDLAGPTAVIEASGGIVTDENGNSLKFGTQDTRPRYLVATNPGVHSRVLEILQKLGA